MAGSNKDFDAALFRDQIHQAMEMGDSAAEPVAWRWLTKRTYKPRDEDPAGLPWTWAATPVGTTTIPDLVVPCAVEFIPSPRQVTDTPIGQFNTARAIVTILDVDYNALLAHAGSYGLTGKDRVPNQAIFGVNTYNLNFEAPVTGLFEVDVHQLHLTAEDES